MVKYIVSLFMELYKNTFFLHSFLDEYIGSGKGNNIMNVIDNFLKYLPDANKQYFKESFQYCEHIAEIQNDISNVENVVNKIANSPTDYQNEYIPSDYSYAYEFNKHSVKNDDSMHTVRHGDRVFLKSLFQNDIKKFPADYTIEYFTKLRLHIDINAENTINDRINKIINEIIISSDKHPIFIPIGYTQLIPGKNGHLVGLLVTKNHLIVANSGIGIDHHYVYNSNNDQNAHSTSNPHTSNQVAMNKQNKLDNFLISVDTKQRTYGPDKQRTYSPDKQRTYGPDKQRTYDSNESSSDQSEGSEDSNESSADRSEGSEDSNESSADRSEGSEDSDESGYPPYPQCILFFKRPKNHILHNVLFEFIQIQTPYTNTDIESVYSLVYKLYYLNLINEKESYITLITDSIKTLIKEQINNNNFIEDIELSITNPSSKIMKAVWIHPEYYASDSYTINISNKDIKKWQTSIGSIVSDTLLNTIFSTKIPTIGNLRETIKIQLVNFLIMDSNSFKVFDYVQYEIILHNISDFVRTKQISRTPRMTKIIHEHWKVNSGEMNSLKTMEQLYNGMYDKNDFWSISYSERENIIEEIKKSKQYTEMADNKYKRYEEDFFGFQFTEENVESVERMIDGSLSKELKNEIYEAIKNSKSFDLLEKIDQMIEKVKVIIKNDMINNFEIDKIDNYTNNETLVNLFTGILLHSVTFQGNSIIITKNNETLKNGNDMKENPLIQQLIKIIDLPELAKKITVRKIKSVYAGNFFVREQYAGSCSFNGIFLAATLLSDSKFAVNPNNNLKDYVIENRKLLQTLRDNQINEIINNNSPLSQRDRLIVDALETMYLNENREMEHIEVLKKKLPELKYSNLSVRLETQRTKKKISIVDKYYRNQQPCDNYNDVIKKFDNLLEIFKSSAYIDHCFVKYYLQPIIIWTIQFDDSTKDIAQIKDIWNKIFEHIGGERGLVYYLSSVEFIKSVYILIIYLVFKALDMTKAFDEKLLEEINNDYLIKKKNNDVFINNLYLSTRIDTNVLTALIDQITKHQSIIVHGNINDVLKINKLVNLVEATKKMVKFDIVEKYKIFCDILPIKILHMCFRNRMFMDPNKISFNKIRYLETMSNNINKQFDNNKFEPVITLNHNKFDTTATVVITKNKADAENYEEDEIKKNTKLAEDGSKWLSIQYATDFEYMGDYMEYIVRPEKYEKVLEYPKNRTIFVEMKDIATDYGGNKKLELIFPFLIKKLTVNLLIIKKNDNLFTHRDETNKLTVISIKSENTKSELIDLINF